MKDPRSTARGARQARSKSVSHTRSPVRVVSTWSGDRSPWDSTGIAEAAPGNRATTRRIRSARPGASSSSRAAWARPWATGSGARRASERARSSGTPAAWSRASIAPAARMGSGVLWVGSRSVAGWFRHGPLASLAARLNQLPSESLAVRLNQLPSESLAARLNQLPSESLAARLNQLSSEGRLGGFPARRPARSWAPVKAWTLTPSRVPSSRRRGVSTTPAMKRSKATPLSRLVATRTTRIPSRTTTLRSGL